MSSRSELANNPFRHPRKSTNEFFKKVQDSCIQKSHDYAWHEEEKRGEKGSRQSIANILPRKEKWKLY